MVSRGQLLLLQKIKIKSNKNKTMGGESPHLTLTSDIEVMSSSTSHSLRVKQSLFSKFWSILEPIRRIMRVSPLPNYLSLKWLTSDCAASTISKSLLKGFSLSLSRLAWELLRDLQEESLENPDVPTTLLQISG